MYHDKESSVLLVGLDSGSINYIHLDDKRYDESVEIEQHVERVMGVYYDKGLIHSISID